MSKNLPENLVERPPIVAVMGHVDHGKSTLLDYIRKTNIVAGEHGGITQHISAYELEHKNADGFVKKITFLDTPGHEAFSNMRSRGAKAADIAILVVAADDGVNAQTKEVFETIKETNTPFIVAITKTDKPSANIQKTKNSLVENGIYIEGYGGDISVVEVSAKTGDGIPELLETILLTAEMEELRGDLNQNATGLVIESHLDEKRGISATLVIKNGTLKKGMFIVADDTISTTRIFESFTGEKLSEAHFSSPISITGFTCPTRIFGLVKVPKVGEKFYSFNTKKEAEAFMLDIDRDGQTKEGLESSAHEFVVPIIIKADVAGTNEAVFDIISKITSENAGFKVVRMGVGDISESDLNYAQADKNVIIVGFNVKVERTALESNEQIGATIKTFNVIYELADWLQQELDNRRPRVEELSVTGTIKVLKIFNNEKNKMVFGGRVLTGSVKMGDTVNIIRRENKIGSGKILGLQQSKLETKEVLEGIEFGGMIDCNKEIAPGDVLEAFVMLKK